MSDGVPQGYAQNNRPGFGSVSGGSSLAAASEQPPTKPLERIERLANRVELNAASLVAFLDRIDGHNAKPQGAMAADPITFGYTNQLDRLEAAVERLEGDLQRLHQFG